MSRDDFPLIGTTSDEDGELFGVHIPELQLSIDDYRAGIAAAGLAADEYYLELGSGHGIGLVVAAREFEADAHGVEYLDDAIARAYERAERAGVRDRIDIVRGDVRRTNVASADVLHMHLGPAFHDVLAAQLEQQLTPGARVIAAGWQVPGWLPSPSALEAWDFGYVYRPADPKWQLAWSAEPPVQLAATSEDDSIAWRTSASVHADLAGLELRVEGPDADQVVAVLDRTSAARGTTLHVAYSAPDDARFHLALWGRSRNGRFTQRGDVFAPRLEARDEPTA